MLDYCLLAICLQTWAADTTPVAAHVYLTFDDGPIAASRIVKELVDGDTIPVNMFIIGKYVQKNDTMRTLFDSLRADTGIELGNHSYSHANRHYRLYYSDPASAVRDILLNADTLQLSNKLVRLPGRNMWRLGGRSRSDLESGRAVADSLAALGYLLFGWDIEWQADSCGKMTRTADEMMAAIEHMLLVRSGFTPGYIVLLLHDAMMDSPYNYTQLKAFVQQVKAHKGWLLEPLSKYPKETMMVAGEARR